jgi:hypothetical protein
MWDIRQLVRMLAEDIVKIHCQEMTSENERLYVCCSYSDP